MKNKVQLLGKTLGGMIMPNIGAFIAWGLITSLFIPEGWIPNASFGEEKVCLILAIAGMGDDHLTILSQLASILTDETSLSILINSQDKQTIYNLLTT